jgi:hypothetical protein
VNLVALDEWEYYSDAAGVVFRKKAANTSVSDYQKTDPGCTSLCLHKRVLKVAFIPEQKLFEKNC